MRLQFKQAAYVGKKHFGVGIHTVSEELYGNRFLQKLIKAKMVIEPEKEQPVRAGSSEEHQNRLAEKLSKALTKKAAPPVAPIPAEVKPALVSATGTAAQAVSGGEDASCPDPSGAPEFPEVEEPVSKKIKVRPHNR